MAVPRWMFVHSSPCVKLTIDTRKANRTIPPGAYPFNHSQSYWLESRFSRGLRFRKHAKLDLLGVPSPDWNSLEPQWRNVIRSNEIPWIEDHKINGVCIYPAAGMLSMAVEAARQIAGDNGANREITGYRIENAQFLKVLNIALHPAHVETLFYLRPLKDALEKEDTWSEFRLCVYEDSKWEECCRGRIQVEYERLDNQVDNGKEAKQEALYHKEVVDDGFKNCDIPMATQQLYEMMSNIGAQYGPAFQVLKNLRYNSSSRESAAEVSLGQWTVGGNRKFAQPYTFHPTTLDGLFQTIVPALSEGGNRKLPTMVPSRIGMIWVSAFGTADPDGPPIRAYSKSQFKGYREAESSIRAVSSKTGHPCIILENLESTFVTNDRSTSDAEDMERHLCCSLEWKPDLDILPRHQVLEYCEVSRPKVASPDRFYKNLRLVIFFYITDAVARMAQTSTSLEYHMDKYLGWMKEQLRRYDIGDISFCQDELDQVLADCTYRDLLIEYVEHATSEGRLFVAVGRNLFDIFCGTVDPLNLLFEGNLVEDYYQEQNSAPHVFAPFSVYLEALTHKNPSMKILEIGAGTGGATLPVLEALSTHGAQEKGVTRYSSYDFTDISPGFFERAQEKFKGHRETMSYKILDIEIDPCRQGYEEGYYDLVLASNVLHATQNIKSTLLNVRKLLKPGGKLVLFEVTEPHMMRTGFAFGLLKGWWLATNEDRPWSPCLTEMAWNDALRQTGFSGVDFLLPDHHEPEFHESSIMIATAVKSVVSQDILFESPTTIVTVGDFVPQQEMGRQLQHQLTSIHRSPCELLSLEQAASASSLDVASHIFLLEMDNAFLSKIKENEFAWLKCIIRSSDSILWVSRDQGSTFKRPDFDMITGFARSIRSEYSQLKFVTLALSGTTSSTASTEYILRVLRQTAMSSIDQIEPEYRQRDEMLEISRLLGTSSLNRMIVTKTASQKSRIQRFANGIPLTLQVAAPGLLDSLEFHEDYKTSQPLSDDEIEVEVKVTGVNFRDFLITLGRLSDDFIGSECAGIVERVGNQVTAFRKGDRVSVSSMNAYKTYMRANASCAIRIPDEMSFVQAASLPTAALTVYHALLNIARLQKGETVLIHAGAGATGQMAIQLAQYIQAKVYATVGSREKKQLIIDLYGVPEENIFYSRDNSFAQGIKRVTHGRGVDVILNSLSGQGLKASWECISPFGRFIEIGKANILSHKTLQMTQFANNVSFAAVDLLGIVRERPLLLQELFQNMMTLVKEGKLQPAQPVNVYPISEITQAFRYLQGGKNVGKTVIRYGRDDLVTTVLKNKPKYDFDHEASYLIAGGLGGLGRSIARWMASRGARHLILLSRSGPKSGPAKDLLKELRLRGVQVEAPGCDICQSDALSQVLEECARTMPPIKGCIQGTMVLRDAIFDKMSYDDFIVSTKPKVAGSWNLHTLLPKGMDFFILLSSICGIFGAASQVNYCTGNTYKDALAHFRVVQGEKAVSLDLGMMLAEGVVAENDGLMGFLKRTGYFMEISQPELFALLDHYCDPALPILAPLECQAIVGIEIPAVLDSRGIDQPYWMQRPMFRHFHQIKSEDTDLSANANSITDYAALLRDANSTASAATIVSGALANKIAKVMGTQAQDVDLGRPMHAYGVDSLVAVEVRNWLLREMGADIAIFDILGTASISDLSSTIAARSRYRRSSA